MLKKIETILRNHKDDDTLVITEETTFEELEIDSLETVELVMSIEDDMGITIEINEAVKTIGDLIKIIEAAK